MISDFNDRWGDGSDVLSFQYGQTGSGKGQSCGYTPEQILQYVCDPRMINLSYGEDSVPEDKETETTGIWWTWGGFSSWVGGEDDHSSNRCVQTGCQSSGEGRGGLVSSSHGEEIH